MVVYEPLSAGDTVSANLGNNNDGSLVGIFVDGLLQGSYTSTWYNGTLGGCGPNGANVFTASLPYGSHNITVQCTGTDPRSELIGVLRILSFSYVAL